MTRYDWRLRGLAHALLLDPAHVDAVLRVAYVRAWREVVRIDPSEDAAAWLYRVVYNGCIDGLRRESARIGAAPPTAPDVPDTADPADPPDAAADPPVEPMPAGGNGDTPGTTGVRRVRVVEALAALAPADRVAVVLVDREGFPPEAAARILGLTPDGMQARLAGARARLANQLADVLAAPAAPADEAGPLPDEAETQVEMEAQAEEPQAASEETEAQSEEPQGASEEPKAELDDTTSADPADTKVASRSTAGGSPNGSSGAATTNGSDDSGGGAS